MHKVGKQVEDYTYWTCIYVVVCVGHVTEDPVTILLLENYLCGYGTTLGS